MSQTDSLNDQELRKKLVAIIDEPMTVENMELMIGDLTGYVVDKMMPFIDAYAIEAQIKELEPLVPMWFESTSQKKYLKFRIDELKAQLLKSNRGEKHD